MPVEATNKPKVKLMIIIGGAFMALVLIIAVIAAAVGGSDTPVAQVDSSLAVADETSVSFTTGVPEGWSVTPVSQGSFSSITASPTEVTEGDITSITIGRDTETATPEEIIAASDKVFEGLGDAEQMALFDSKVTDLNTQNYGTEEFPAIWITYLSESISSGTQFGVQEFYVLLSDNTPYSARFIYSSAFPEFPGIVNPIVESYAPR